MKEQQQSRTENYERLILSREDLASLYRILQGVGEPFKFVIGKWQIEDQSEIANVSIEEIATVSAEITGRPIYVTLAIYPESARVYASNERNAVSLATFTQITDLLNKRRRWRDRYKWGLHLTAWGATWVPIGAAVVSHNLLWVGASLLWALFVYFTLWRSYRYVALIDRKQASFFVRKRDEIILVGISGVVSFVLGIVAAMLLQHLTSSGPH